MGIPLFTRQDIRDQQSFGAHQSTRAAMACSVAHPAAAILAVYHAGLLHCAHILEEGRQSLISVSPRNALDNHLKSAQGLSVLLQHDSRSTNPVKGRVLSDTRVGSKQQ